MGSLISKPKAPKPIIITSPVSVPVASSPPAEEGVPLETEESGKQQDADEGAVATKSENLLKRSRGRLGTILTSFRGVLSDGAQGAAQKSLLGE